MSDLNRPVGPVQDPQPAEPHHIPPAHPAAPAEPAQPHPVPPTHLAQPAAPARPPFLTEGMKGKLKVLAAVGLVAGAYAGVATVVDKVIHNKDKTAPGAYVSTSSLPTSELPRVTKHSDL